MSSAVGLTWTVSERSRTRRRVEGGRWLKVWVEHWFLGRVWCGRRFHRVEISMKGFLIVWVLGGVNAAEGVRRVDGW